MDDSGSGGKRSERLGLWLLVAGLVIVVLALLLRYPGDSVPEAVGYLATLAVGVGLVWLGLVVNGLVANGHVANGHPSARREVLRADVANLAQQLARLEQSLERDQQTLARGSEQHDADGPPAATAG